jgi:hypothetical protein
MVFLLNYVDIITLNSRSRGSRRETNHTRMSHGYSGSVSERQSPIFLQAMGWRARVPAGLDR